MSSDRTFKDLGSPAQPLEPLDPSRPFDPFNPRKRRPMPKRPFEAAFRETGEDYYPKEEVTIFVRERLVV